MTRTLSCALLLLLAAGCAHTPSEKDIELAQIHYDLGVQTQQQDPQGAYREYERALKLNPKMPEAHNATAILLHVSFRRPQQAIEHYLKAIELRPEFSEAKTNLGNVYLDQNRYDEAIALYREVLNDMLYPTPYIAQGNLGWALFKKGDLKSAVDQIKAAVTTNPKFCLGHKNLGIIYDEQGNQEQSCNSFGRYREHCPEVADAYMREGVCLAAQGKVEVARERFNTCVAKAATDAMKEDCQRLVDELK